MLYERVSLVKDGYVVYEDEAILPLTSRLYAPKTDLPELEKLKTIPGVPLMLMLAGTTRLGIWLGRQKLGEVKIGRTDAWVKALLKDLKELANHPEKYILQ